jgi:phage terminase small subunit
MPVLRNPRWELFAQGLASGKLQTEAYATAGFTYRIGGSSRSNPSKLAKKPEIISRVTELTRERDVENRKALAIATANTGITKTWIMARLKENVERAMQIVPVLDKEGNSTGEFTYNGFVANKGLGHKLIKGIPLAGEM